MAFDVRDKYRKNHNITSGNMLTQDIGLSLDRDMERDARLKAIEKARRETNNSFNMKTNDIGFNNINAGNDRTTALRQPQQNIQGNAILPTYSGQNIAADGANVNTDFKTEAATKNSWKGLIGSKSQEQTISKEQSLAHANEVYAPYKDNQEVTDLFKQYVSTNDDLENLRMHGASADQKYHYVREKQKLEKEIRNITGMSKDDFNQVAENYTYLRHDEERQSQQERLDNASGVEKAALTGLNVATSAIGNYQSALGLLRKPNDPELGRDYNAVTSYWSNLSRDTKEAVHEDIDESTMADYQKALAGFGYDAFTMGAESAASQLLGGAGLASFFAGGYASSLEEAEQRGLTKGQAQGYALVSGGLEYATEKIPFDNLKNIFKGKAVSKEAVKGSLMPYVKALFKQAREEATEEVINGVGDILADALINSDKSKINIAIQNYMQEEGLSEEEATRKAFFEEGKDILYAAASAAVSAGASAGPALTVQAYETTKAGRNLADYENKTGNLTRNVENENYIPETRENYVADEDYRQAQETRQAILAASEKAAKNERISGREARALAESYGQTADNLRTAQKVEGSKLIEGARAKAEERAIEQIKEASTPAEVETIKEENINSEAVQAAVAEKKAEMIEAGKATEAEFTEAITPTKAAAMAESGEIIEQEVLEQLPEKVQQAYETGKASQANKLTSDVSKMDISTIEYADSEGKKIHADIKSVSENESGEIVFNLSNGETVKAAEVDYTPNGRQLYNSPNGINSLDNPTLIQLAIDIERNSKHGVAVGNVTLALKDMYTMGAAGLDFDQAIKSRDFDLKTLGKDNLRAAYEEGKKNSTATSRATYAKKGSGLIKESSAENEQAYKKQFVKRIEQNGKTVYEADESVRTEYENQLPESSKDFLELFSKKIGVDIAFFSENSNDRGFYEPKDGTIYLNLYHSHNMFNVALHEGIGEFMAASNEKAYNAIVDSVLNAYAANNSTKLAKDIRAYQAAYEGDTYGGTYRGAAQELFNDALSDMFSSEENMQKMFNWMAANEGEKQTEKVKKTLVDYLKSVKDTIHDVLTKGVASTVEERKLKLSEKEASTYVDQILKAMDQAIANRDAEVVQQGEIAPRNSLDLKEVLPTAKERNEYYRWLSDVKQKLNKSIPKSGRGEYIFQIGNKLVFNMGKEPNITQFVDIIGHSKDNTIANIIQRSVITDEWTTNKRRFASYGRHWCDFIEAYTGEEINIIRYFERDNSTNTKQGLGNKNVLFQEVTADPDNSTNRARNNREIERTSAQYESLKQKLAESDEETVRHSFAGINAATANKEQLKKAQELQKKGMGDIAILGSTGWFLGMDNQWKFEIPDNDLEIFKEGNRAYVQNNPDFKRYLELENKILFTDSDYTAEEYDELLRLDKIVSADEYYKTKQYGKLSDYIQHDELFRAYPWLENVDVLFVPLDDNTKGQAMSDYLTIALNEKFQTDVGWNKDALKSTLLHEIQHLIQNNENFARGSNPAWWADIKEERIEADKKTIAAAEEYLEKYVKKAEAAGEPTSTGDFVKRSIDRVTNPDDSYNMNDHWAAVAEWKADSGIYHYEHMISKLERHIDRMLSESDIELYYNTAGEIEARDTANRANMTKEQRLENFPVQNARDVVYPTGSVSSRRYSIKVDTEGRSLSEGQQEYFKNSKVVDEEGRLRVVYHGTMAEFNIFNLKEARDTEDIEAFFFSGDIEEAEGYGNLGEYYLNITNPADYKTAYDIFFKYKGKEHAGRLAREKLQSMGYDGVIAVDEDSPEYTEYLAFNSNQIKRVSNTNPTENEDVRYSKNVDIQYFEAIKENDTETMQQLVNKAAKNAGYNSPLLYHGTQSFGFTNFDLDKMDDKSTIFLTSNSNIASTYSGTSQLKNIEQSYNGDINAIPTNKLADELNKVSPDDGMQNVYEYYNDAKINELKDNTLDGIRKLYDELPALLDTITDEKALTALKKIREMQMLFNVEEVMEKENLKKDLSTAIYMGVHHSKALNNYKDEWDKLQQNIRKAYALIHDRHTSDEEFIVENYLDGYLFEVLTPTEARMTLKENVNKGIYSLYAKLGNSLEIDAQEHLWNDLGGVNPLREIIKSYDKDNTHIEKDSNGKWNLVNENGAIVSSFDTMKYGSEVASKYQESVVQNNLLSVLADDFAVKYPKLYTTREIAKAAKFLGYDSVVIKNVRDNGGRNHKIDYDETADIYLLFNPDNVKSADPITYDEQGNIIPLSERFNQEKNDLRFSISVDSDGKELSDNQKEFFKDSKVVDDNGNLLVLYHGSTSSDKFTEFNLDAKGLVNGRVLGDGFYFTPDKKAAKHWSRGNNNVYKVYLNIKNPYYASAEDKVPKDVKEVLVKHYEELYDKFADEDPKWKIKNPIKKLWVESTFKRNAPDAESALAALNWGDDVANKSDLLKSLGYDGIIHKDSPKNFALIGGEQYVAFNPNQIKNVSNKKPSESSDIRYSKAVFGEDSQYSDQIEQTKFVSQILSTLNNQLKGTTVSMNYIDDTVKYILDKYDANLNAEDFKMELAQFIAYMTTNEQVDYNQMMNYLLNIGDEVIQASQLKDPEEERVYSELKKELSRHKINLTEIERKELIAKYGGSWNAVFGKLNAAGIKLNKEGQHMDGSIYQEISDTFRQIAGVQLDEEKSAVDQVATILDAMEALKPTAYQWEGATNLDKALDVATTIIDRYYSMASNIKEANIVKGTDKGAAAVERAKQSEIKKLRAKQQEYKAKVNEEFNKLVEDRKKVIENQIAFEKRNAEIQRKFAKEQEEATKQVELSKKEIEKTAKLMAKMEYQGLKDTEAKKKQKDNIVRTCMRLINWMNKPTDTRHVPTFLKPALTDMIKSINFMPASMRRGEDGTISAIKWQESMLKLQQVIQGIQNADADSLDDSDKYNLSLVMETEEIVNKMQQLLDKYGGTADVSRMKPEDLKVLSDIMTSISRSISKMNENFMNRRFQHVSEAAVASMNEMNELKPISNTMGFAKSTLSDFLNLDMAEPITFFEELGSASESIMQEFFDGEKIGIEIIEEADNFFESLAKEYNLTAKDLRAWENDRKDYNFGGVPITLTSADLMSLYCSYNREKLDQKERPNEATHHIAAGGIKGFRHRIGFNEVNRNPQVAHLTEADVVRLLENLTETQKQYADAVVSYMSTTLAAHGNETSNKLNGYSKFNGKYYFPLKTDNNAIATTESNNTSDQAAFRRLIFPSFTKSQVDKADNALVVMNFFDVVTEHITGMSNYCAYAMPISDAMRWYNYAETERANTEVEDQYQRYTTSVKGAMDRVRGEEARKYFEQFIRDVNLDNKASGSKASKLISQGLTGLAKAKAVGLNVRVILQQPCAIIRAADVIEGKYLAEGWAKMSKNPKAAAEYAQKESYLCYWKSKGFSDTRVSQSMKEIITGQESIRQDIVEKTGALAGLADDVTWASMYYAAEAKIEATTDLQKGTEEFHAAVEELFSDIINHTQVIDSQLRKTGTMRSNDAIEKLANAFKKEPQKSYNMLHRAYWKVYQDPTNAEAKKGWQRAVTIFVENAFVTAIAQSLVDAWRDDDDEDSYLMKMIKKMLPYDSYATVRDFVDSIMKGEVKAKDVLGLIQGIYGGAGNILDNANIASSIPYIADIDSLLKGYSVTRLDSTSILTQLKNTVTTLGSTNATPYSIIYSLAQLVGYATGIGADNALRDLRGIYNQFLSDMTGVRIEKNAATAKKNAKKKETNRVSEVFDSNDLSSIKAEIKTAYDKGIESSKDGSESDGWTAARNMLKEQYKRLLAEHPEDKATLNNRFKSLLKNTKKADGKGGYRTLTDKEIQNYIDNWSAAE